VPEKSWRTRYWAPPLWLQGRSAARDWLLANAKVCGGAVLEPIAANGSAAFAVYKPALGGGLEVYSVQVCSTCSTTRLLDAIAAILLHNVSKDLHMETGSG